MTRQGTDTTKEGRLFQREVTGRPCVSCCLCWGDLEGVSTEFRSAKQVGCGGGPISVEERDEIHLLAPCNTARVGRRSLVSHPNDSPCNQRALKLRYVPFNSAHRCCFMCVPGQLPPCIPHCMKPCSSSRKLKSQMLFGLSVGCN